MEECIEKAKRGDTDEMCDLHMEYSDGSDWGYSKVLKGAVPLLEMAAKGGSPVHKVPLALLYLEGFVDEPTGKRVSDGLVLMTEAAMEGSDAAAAYLGSFYVDGKHGLHKDLDKGRRWLDRCLSGQCAVKHMTETDREVAVWARSACLPLWSGGQSANSPIPIDE